ncbi:hypothetical protein CDO52_06190 [Nocardiopsis gilva YIM 90087]|uniref:Integrase catalytic domain-containing protein n=1 Tax=Nocardiopsis gilva YIM 90087 TaxID=1235441 RepID=A0A223S2S9_9ACTN|nr:hypothetical protein CDO52_06190 [Nocardiopsis gilva YIM 90087]
MRFRPPGASTGAFAGTVLHSDHGAQYTSEEFEDLCDRLGAVWSMGAVGLSADNPAAEASNATLKRETLYGRALRLWASPRVARLAVFSWIGRCNTRRRHTANGQLSPRVYEQWAVSLRLAASSDGVHTSGGMPVRSARTGLAAGRSARNALVKNQRDLR